ncbi:MAG: DNA metabolism protein, partial [Pygmaiobacter sp.]
MFHESNVIYTYDGSYDGVLCCVFHAFEKKERPLAILPEETLQPTLCEVIPIETDLHRANRVAAVLEPKISRRAAETVQALYLCAVRDKELLMLDFIRLGLETGRSVTTMLGNETVAAVAQAVKHLYKEAQNYKGFL